MPYHVLKKLDGDEYWYKLPPYEGKTCLHDGLLYSATNLSPPTKFNSKHDAELAINVSKKAFKNYRFMIIKAVDEEIAEKGETD